MSDRLAESDGTLWWSEASIEILRVPVTGAGVLSAVAERLHFDKLREGGWHCDCADAHKHELPSHYRTAIQLWR